MEISEEQYQVAKQMRDFLLQGVNEGRGTMNMGVAGQLINRWDEIELHCSKPEGTEAVYHDPQFAQYEQGAQDGIDIHGVFTQLQTRVINALISDSLVEFSTGIDTIISAKIGTMIREIAREEVQRIAPRTSAQLLSSAFAALAEHAKEGRLGC